MKNVLIIFFLLLSCALHAQIVGRSLVYRGQGNPNLILGLSNQNDYSETFLYLDINTGSLWDYLEFRIGDKWEKIISVSVSLTNNNDGTYTFIDVDGNTTIISTQEILTSIHLNNNNNLLYVNENGITTPIILPAETITSLTIDSNILSYIDENLDTTQIDLAIFVETVTTLVNNGNNTYTYTNEAGDTTIIDVRQTTSTLVDNGLGSYTYTDELGNETIFNTGQTLTSLTILDSILTYIDENGLSTPINLPTQTLTSLTINDNILTYVNENLDTIPISLPLSNPSVITNTQNGRLIAVHNDGTAGIIPPVFINETITSLSKSGNNLNYINELRDTNSITLPNINTDNQTLQVFQGILSILRAGFIPIRNLFSSRVLNIISGNPIFSHYSFLVETPITVFEKITTLALSGNDLIYTDENGASTTLTIPTGGGGDGARGAILSTSDVSFSVTAPNGYYAIVWSTGQASSTVTINVNPINGDVIDIPKLIDNNIVEFSTGQIYNLNDGTFPETLMFLTDGDITRCIYVDGIWYCKAI